MDDWSLLQEYVHRGSKEALDELVRRHLAMVYAAALRQAREAHLAEDVTQVVFLVLMRRAGRISKSVVLGGWLYQVTAFTAANMLRGERRRAGYERKAAAMKSDLIESAISPPGPESGQAWTAKLDEAIASMPGIYRDAVVMRYLQGKSIHEVAEAQRVSENTARQRLFRALAKLRRKLEREGVVETEEGITSLLAVAGAPVPAAGVEARILSGLHAPGAVGASSSVVTAVVRSLIMAKLKISIAAAAVILLAGIGGGVAYRTMGESQPAGSRAVVLSAAPTTEPAGQAASENTPNAVVVNVMSAFVSGDVDAMIAEYEPLPAEQEALMRKLGRTADAVAALRSALTKRFGAGAAERFISGIKIEPSQDDMSAVARATATIDGNSAELKAAHIGLVRLVKIKGSWKLKSDTFYGTFLQMIAGAPILERLAANVDDGQYSSIKECRDDFRNSRDLLRADPDVPPDRPAVLGPGATPQETLAALYWAAISGDEKAVIACLEKPTPGQVRAARLNTKMYCAGEQVRAAVAGRFGQLVGRAAVMTLGFDTGITKTLLAKAPTTFAGDKAQVDMQRKLGVTFSLTKTSGVWRVEPIFDMPDPPRPWDVLLRDHYLPLVLQLAADVKAGKFAKVEQVKTAVEALHQQIKADHDRLAGAAVVQ